MIYFVRHGLDDENYIGGWSSVDLVQEGLDQIKKTRKYIEDNLKFEYILTSDIKRALNTSNIINDKLRKKIIVNIDFRELNKGNLNGKLKNDLSVSELDMLKNMNIFEKYPNGESMIDFYRRMKILLNHLKKLDNVLVVTHRGVINMFYYILNDIDLDMDKEKFNVTHGSIHECNIEKKYIRRIY